MFPMIHDHYGGHSEPPKRLPPLVKQEACSAVSLASRAYHLSRAGHGKGVNDTKLLWYRKQRENAVTLAPYGIEVT